MKDDTSKSFFLTFRAVSAARERHAKALSMEYDGEAIFSNDNQAQYNYAYATSERKLAATAHLDDPASNGNGDDLQVRFPCSTCFTSANFNSTSSSTIL